MKKFLLTLIGLLACFGMAQAKQVTDVLTNQTCFNSSASGYASHDYTGPSGAEYNFNCAGTNYSIQLRTSGNDAGVVVTKSPGKVVSVEIAWNSSNTASRTLNVYSSNIAYTSPGGLYANGLSTATTFQSVNGTQTYTFTDQPSYIGFRSAENALYLESITIVWEVDDSGTTLTPAGLTFPSADYSARVGEPFTAPVLSKQTDAAVTYASSETSVATVNPATGDVTIVAAGTTVISASTQATAEYEAGFAQYTLTVSPALAGNTVVEMLTPSNFDLTTTYAEHTYTSDLTGITYNAYAYKGNNPESIQIRSNDSKSGITVTDNPKGYKVLAIELVQTSASQIDIYDKAEAYTNPEDLYNSSNQGTKVGSISATNGSLDFDNPQAFWGLRSSSGARYITSLKIIYEAPEVEPTDNKVTINFTGVEDAYKYIRLYNDVDEEEVILTSDTVEVSYPQTESWSRLSFAFQDGYEDEGYTFEVTGPNGLEEAGAYQIMPIGNESTQYMVGLLSGANGYTFTVTVNAPETEPEFQNYVTFEFTGLDNAYDYVNAVDYATIEPIDLTSNTYKLGYDSMGGLILSAKDGYEIEIVAPENLKENVDYQIQSQDMDDVIQYVVGCMASANGATFTVKVSPVVEEPEGLTATFQFEGVENAYQYLQFYNGTAEEEVTLTSNTVEVIYNEEDTPAILAISVKEEYQEEGYTLSITGPDGPEGVQGKYQIMGVANETAQTMIGLWAGADGYTFTVTVNAPEVEQVVNTVNFEITGVADAYKYLAVTNNRTEEPIELTSDKFSLEYTTDAEGLGMGSVIIAVKPEYAGAYKVEVTAPENLVNEKDYTINDMGDDDPQYNVGVYGTGANGATFTVTVTGITYELVGSVILNGTGTEEMVYEGDGNYEVTAPFQAQFFYIRGTDGETVTNYGPDGNNNIGQPGTYKAQVVDDVTSSDVVNRWVISADMGDTGTIVTWSFNPATLELTIIRHEPEVPTLPEVLYVATYEGQSDAFKKTDFTPNENDPILTYDEATGTYVGEFEWLKYESTNYNAKRFYSVDESGTVTYYGYTSDMAINVNLNNTAGTAQSNLAVSTDKEAVGVWYLFNVAADKTLTLATVQATVDLENNTVVFKKLDAVVPPITTLYLMGSSYGDGTMNIREPMTQSTVDKNVFEIEYDVPVVEKDNGDNMGGMSTLAVGESSYFMFFFSTNGSVSSSSCYVPQEEQNIEFTPEDTTFEATWKSGLGPAATTNLSGKTKFTFNVETLEFKAEYLDEVPVTPEFPEVLYVNIMENGGYNSFRTAEIEPVASEMVLTQTSEGVYEGEFDWTKYATTDYRYARFYSLDGDAVTYYGNGPVGEYGASALGLSLTDDTPKGGPVVSGETPASVGAWYVSSFSSTSSNLITEGKVKATVNLNDNTVSFVKIDAWQPVPKVLYFKASLNATSTYTTLEMNPSDDDPDVFEIEYDVPFVTQGESSDMSLEALADDEPVNLGMRFYVSFVSGNANGTNIVPQTEDETISFTSDNKTYSETWKIGNGQAVDMTPGNTKFSVNWKTYEMNIEYLDEIPETPEFPEVLYVDIMKNGGYNSFRTAEIEPVASDMVLTQTSEGVYEGEFDWTKYATTDYRYARFYSLDGDAVTYYGNGPVGEYGASALGLSLTDNTPKGGEVVSGETPASVGAWYVSSFSSTSSNLITEGTVKATVNLNDNTVSFVKIDAWQPVPEVLYFKASLDATSTYKTFEIYASDDDPDVFEFEYDVPFVTKGDESAASLEALADDEPVNLGMRFYVSFVSGNANGTNIVPQTADESISFTPENRTYSETWKIGNGQAVDMTPGLTKFSVNWKTYEMNIEYLGVFDAGYEYDSPVDMEFVTSVTTPETVEVPVSIVLPAGETISYAGYQFDITLPEWLTLESATPNADFAGGVVTSQPNNVDGNVWRVMGRLTQAVTETSLVDDIVTLKLKVNGEISWTDGVYDSFQVKVGDNTYTVTEGLVDAPISNGTYSPILGSPSTPLNGFDGQINVIITKRVPLESAEIESAEIASPSYSNEPLEDGTGNVTKGESIDFTVKTEPADATDELEWSSNVPGVEFEFDQTTGELVVDTSGVEVAPGETVDVTITGSAPGLDEDVTFTFTVRGVLYGDSNDDLHVDVADVVTTANYLASGVQEDPTVDLGEWLVRFDFPNANVKDVADNEKDVITVEDLNATVNIALGIWDGKNDIRRKARTIVNTDRLVADDFQVRNNRPFSIGVGLDNTNAYSSIEALIEVPAGMTVENVTAGPRLAGHTIAFNTLSNGNVKVVVYSKGNAAFRETSGALFNLVVTAEPEVGDLNIVNILAADAAANGYSLEFEGGLNGSIATGIDGIDADDSDVRYFTVDGIEVFNPEKGQILIRIEGDKAEKVVIK